jgi:hypothetical protein
LNPGRGKRELTVSTAFITKDDYEAILVFQTIKGKRGVGNVSATDVESDQGPQSGFPSGASPEGYRTSNDPSVKGMATY